ncbi:MAG TPA: HAD family hydrolase [Actinomycetota bacterium]|jgi:phosphoglycolate phosphatase-like HAD superfamily hydrolase|nr:HAD family hydrolase [Actinomycetota bacterium]
MRTKGGLASTGPLAILFDIDGTLLTTGGAGARSWTWAFETLYGVPADIGKFSEDGMTDPDVARGTFRGAIGREPSDRELARVLAAYLERVPHEVGTSDGYRVLPGARDLLERLRREGYLMGVVTGALEAAAHIKLARGGLNGFFAFGGYGSDSPERDELTRRAIDRASGAIGRRIDAKSVYVVGDTPKDIQAAHAVGAVGVGVASGKYSVDDLRAANADISLDSLEEPMPGLETISDERT